MREISLLVQEKGYLTLSSALSIMAFQSDARLSTNNSTAGAQQHASLWAWRVALV